MTGTGFRSSGTTVGSSGTVLGSPGEDPSPSLHADGMMLREDRFLVWLHLREGAFAP